MIGVAHHLRLPKPVQVDPAAIPTRDLERLGIKALPSSFRAASESLLSDDNLLLRELLGKEAVQCLLAVRNSEWERMADMDFGAEVSLLADRY